MTSKYTPRRHGGNKEAWNRFGPEYFAGRYENLTIPELESYIITHGIRRHVYRNYGSNKSELIRLIEDFNAGMVDKGKETDDKDELNSMKVNELRRLATEHKLQGRSKMNKGELIEALSTIPNVASSTLKERREKKKEQGKEDRKEGQVSQRFHDYTSGKSGTVVTEWKNNAKDGMEVVTTSTGDSHTTTWSRGRRHGLEVFVTRDGNVVKTRYWIDDREVSPMEYEKYAPGVIESLEPYFIPELRKITTGYLF